HLRARISWYQHLRGSLMTHPIVRLDGHLDAEVSEPPSDRLLAGHPQLEVRNFFTDSSQQFFAGRWSATRGKWRVRYTENELCVMTAGRVIIESDTGARESFAAGDAFVVPAGFSGTWEVVEDCTKIYGIFEARS
ncbi:MAG TPA: cupin domain-containing protein, partial [Steroidobacteraceae bacterium]|nr:cupin domain-containing protein [Steroidobacteraceae bacterium]